MGDGWTLGLLTICAIAGGAACFSRAASCFIRPEGKREPSAKSPYTIPDYPKILRDQAVKAEGRRRNTVDGLNLNDWLSLAAHHLMKIWPDMSYDRAMTELRDYLADIIAEWPSPDIDWSVAAAMESAEEYAREYGEQYGANA